MQVYFGQNALSQPPFIWLKYFSLALHWACSSADNPLNHSNHNAVNYHRPSELPGEKTPSSEI